MLETHLFGLNGVWLLTKVHIISALEKVSGIRLAVFWHLLSSEDRVLLNTIVTWLFNTALSLLLSCFYLSCVFTISQDISSKQTKSF